MSLKSLTTAVAAAAMVGAAALGVTALASAAPTASAPAVEPVAFGVPLPLDPAASAPTTAELTSILSRISAPGVRFRDKGYLIEGGIGIIEGRTADRLLNNANDKGYLPLSFTVSDVALGAPGQVSANVDVSGPQLTPTTQAVTFVDQGGWKLSRASAMSLLQTALATS